MTPENSRRTRAPGWLLPLAAFAVFAAAAGTAQIAAQAPMPPQSPEPPRSTLPGSPPAVPRQVVPAEPVEKPAGPPAVCIVLDPAHGGSDSGAHVAAAEEGVPAEKDLVLTIAQGMRRELERQGARVLLTRQSDVSLSIDERAALVNGTAQCFFVSLHIGSSGRPDTAVAYSFGAPTGGAPPVVLPHPAGLLAIRWEEAQNAYLVASRRLAELVQVELAQKLPGSPDVPQLAEVRQLRVVARPAVAIELASVAEENPESLVRTAAPLASALLRAVAAYRQSGGGLH